MGIVYVENGQGVVFEAVEPVKSTPLKEWVARGENGHYVVKRLAQVDELLTSKTLKSMRKVGEKFAGKPYDIYFQWSNERIYCSELVWKVFQESVGVEIGELQTLGTFDLSDPEVEKLMFDRFGGPAPDGEPVISPAAMFDSDLLVSVYEN